MAEMQWRGQFQLGVQERTFWGGGGHRIEVGMKRRTWGGIFQVESTFLYFQPSPPGALAHGGQELPLVAYLNIFQALFLSHVMLDGEAAGMSKNAWFLPSRSL